MILPKTQEIVDFTDLRLYPNPFIHTATTGARWLDTRAVSSPRRSSLIITRNFGPGGDSTMVVCAGGTDCAFWDATYIVSFPAFFISLFLTIVVSLFTQKLDPPKPITDIDGNPIDVNPLHRFGINPIKDALRKLRKEEYDQ